MTLLTQDEVEEIEITTTKKSRKPKSSRKTVRSQKPAQAYDSVHVFAPLNKATTSLEAVTTQTATATTLKPTKSDKNISSFSATHKPTTMISQDYKS